MVLCLMTVNSYCLVVQSGGGLDFLTTPYLSICANSNSSGIDRVCALPERARPLKLTTH